MPELKKNVLNFGYSANFKYQGNGYTTIYSLSPVFSIYCQHCGLSCFHCCLCSFPFYCFCVSQFFLHFLFFQFFSYVFYAFYFWHHVILLTLYEDTTNGSLEYVFTACFWIYPIQVIHCFISIRLPWGHGLKGYIHMTTLGYFAISIISGFADYLQW